MATLKDRIEKILTEGSKKTKKIEKVDTESKQTLKEYNKMAKGILEAFRIKDEVLGKILDEIDKEQKILRPALRWFAEICEGELRKNETEKGWLNGRYTFYLRRAKGNLREIHVGGFEQDSGDAEIIKSCADASNFCMMLAHNIIERARLEEEEEEAISKCQR